MLNKEICRLCSRQYALSVPRAVNIDKWFSWSDESSFVWCPKNYEREQHYYADIKGPPPLGCPYLLEHTLTEYEKDNTLSEPIKA